MEAGILAGASLLGSRSQSRAADRATDAQVAAQREAIAAQQQAAAQARQDAIPLFSQAQNNALMGYGAGLGLLGQTIPQQMQAFQGGNVAAQNTILAGMPQGISAILGGGVDLSGMQAYNPQLDYSFVQQQLPNFQLMQNLNNFNPTVEQYPTASPSSRRRRNLADILRGVGHQRDPMDQLLPYGDN